MADKKFVTTATLLDMKRKGLKVAMITAYDFPMARIAEEAGVDVVLVGDSVGMTKLGYESTLPVTVSEMLHHTKAVKRGLTRALLVTDMPYLSYELDVREAARHAGRFLKEGGANAVKLEGGMDVAPTVKELVKINVPVFGHLGLTPQAVNRLGGYKIQGRLPEDAERILTDAHVLEAAGCCALVLECVPADLAKEVTKRLRIPTIGIGAGPHCDGQVLVSDDLLGLTEGAGAKFVKRYAELRVQAVKAASDYCREVRDGSFPGPEHSFTSQQ
ncbi:MAG TPA: 3-methyl-2-oxobutanoate hydroxymethyltransferase [Elusimicrobia bacterium]|nr:MAG: 3-methyl-2-oxobutanoate hydroxymethyltransferase [Elusimicrobia bacterium GWA2_66_18]OGR77431.1 MAG: 3-methyl-2-oxobutanoate hydroxymethyltransferase [Elusimicrobia bacterium GWC2_65_9]HAZ09019.1 3-methyl-2-oxobutanoate hydroxymethyltransferase [Elusimicrobiota bacterium]